MTDSTLSVDFDSIDSIVIHNKASGTFTMNSGSITTSGGTQQNENNNSAIKVDGGEVNINGGEISASSAYYGRAIYVTAGIVNILGGSIKSEDINKSQTSTDDDALAKAWMQIIDGGKENKHKYH